MFYYEASEGEREMGTETEHRFYADFNCENCGADLKVAFSTYEYPENTYNSGPDVTMNMGCTVTDMPEIIPDQSYEAD